MFQNKIRKFYKLGKVNVYNLFLKPNIETTDVRMMQLDGTFRLQIQIQKGVFFLNKN